MMLENKTAAIYGGGGAIGGAVARAFAEAGARVYLAGRSRAGSRRSASDIGDAAGVAEVDALDERAVADHADAVAADAGGSTSRSTPCRSRSCTTRPSPSWPSTRSCTPSTPTCGPTSSPPRRSRGT